MTAAATPTDVYLIPGFFGFTNFGEFKYFSHAKRVLSEMLVARGLTAKVHAVRSLPTASLPRRAATLVETIVSTATPNSVIHLIGHSTGGIDARLLLVPGVTLPTTLAVEPVAARVQSTVAISSPHRGSPLADVLTSVMGQQLLQILSMATIRSIRLGKLPLPILTRMTKLLAPVGGMLGARGGLVEQLYVDLLRDFDVEQSRQLEAFFRLVRADRSLLPQLAPPAMELFNTRCTARAGVRYGCVLSQAHPPTLGGHVRTGLNPLDQASYGLFQALYRLTALQPTTVPPLTQTQRSTLREAYGTVPTPGANDAIVPTLSQVWETILAAVWGDHLDLLGYFEDPRATPPHRDWLRSKSGFNRGVFLDVWAKIAGFICAEAQPT